jgi:hypothetical protein
MFAARMISNCGLKSWTTNSEIVHGVASQIAGPYTRVKNEAPVLGTFSHNPSVQRVGPASYLLSHIGCGNGTKAAVTCTNGTTCNQTGWCQPNAQQQPPRTSFLTAAAAAAAAGAQSAAGGGCDSPHWTGFMKSTSPRGPWTPVSTPLLDGSSCGLQVDGGPHAWHSPCITNPNLWPYDNGSVLVAYSTGCANCSTSAGHKHIGIALAHSGLESDEPLEDLTPTEPGQWLDFSAESVASVLTRVSVQHSFHHIRSSFFQHAAKDTQVRCGVRVCVCLQCFRGQVRTPRSFSTRRMSGLPGTCSPTLISVAWRRKACGSTSQRTQWRQIHVAHGPSYRTLHTIVRSSGRTVL